MHDPSYKLLFSHPQMVEDLLRGFVREPWVQHLDFSTLENVTATAISDDLRSRHHDLIWRVRYGPRWLYVYLLLEFQSTVDPYMAVRVLTYVGLLYQDLIRRKELNADGRLPPVFPLVLYNGESRWRAASELSALIEPLPGLEAYQPQQRYWLLDEGVYRDDELSPLRNVVAALFRLEHSREPAAIVEVLTALIEWLQAPEQATLRRAFTEWLRRVLLPARLPGVELPQMQELSEVKDMLAERVKQWTEQWKQEGLEQGRREGRQEGLQQERLLLCRLTQRRFDAATAKQLAVLLQTVDNPDVLTEMGEYLIDATTGAELLAQVRERVDRL